MAILTEQPLGPGWFILFQQYDKPPAGSPSIYEPRRQDEKDIMDLIMIFTKVLDNG